MTVPGINAWLGAVLLAAGLYVIFSREPELLMPEPRHRPWQPLLQRAREMSARWRGNAGVWADDDDPDGSRYVLQLQNDPAHPGPEVYEHMSSSRPSVTTVILPSFESRPRPALVTDQQPPWAVYPEPEFEPVPEPTLKDLVQTGPHAWQPGDRHDPPTLVRGMRAIMADDPDGIGHYVDGLPRYED